MIESAVEKLLPTLNHMKQRPNVWFHEGAYLEGLYTFLLGYSMSAKDHADLQVFALGPDFARWLVAEKGFTGEPALPWPTIVRENCANDDEGFQRAFELISEYNDWPQIDGDLTKF